MAGKLTKTQRIILSMMPRREHTIRKPTLDVLMRNGYVEERFPGTFYITAAGSAALAAKESAGE